MAQSEAFDRQSQIVLIRTAKKYFRNLYFSVLGRS